MKRLFLRSTHRKWSRYHLLTLCSTISAERRRSSALRSDRPASSAKTAQQAHANKTYSFSPENKHKKEIGRLICKGFVFPNKPNRYQSEDKRKLEEWMSKQWVLITEQPFKPQCTLCITCKFWNLDEVITHVSPSPAHFTLIRLFAPPTGCIDRLCPSFYFPPLLGLVALHTSGWAFLVREICSVGLFAWVFCCSFFHF